MAGPASKRQKTMLMPAASEDAGDENQSELQEPFENIEIATEWADNLKGKATACELCSVKPKPDASNWFKSADNDRGHPKPVGNMCDRCGNFCRDSHVDPDMILQNKSKQSPKALEHQLEEYLPDKPSLTK